MTLRAAAPLLALAGLQGCAVASSAVGAAVTVTGAVVVTGVTLTGKAVGAGIDALSAPREPPDTSGIVVRERIQPAPAASP